MHPWYWNYQYPDFFNLDVDYIEYDRYLTPESGVENKVYSDNNTSVESTNVLPL